MEFLMGDALRRGANTIVTRGVLQSNSCRVALAAAAAEGLPCHLVLEERVPNSYDPKACGNFLLYNLLGAQALHVVRNSGVHGQMQMLMQAETQRVMDSLASKEGCNPYLIPTGGSNEIGTLGYVAAALEIVHQLYNMKTKIDYIVVPSGSGGTHAGLLCGLVSMGVEIPIIGIGAGRPNDVQRDLVFSICSKTSALLNLKNTPSMDDILLFDEYIGEGYSIPTKGMVDAVKTLASIEGILLDPVYSGKAMDGFIDLAYKGYFGSGKNILFLVTGGAHSLHANAKEFFAG